MDIRSKYEKPMRMTAAIFVMLAMSVFSACDSFFKRHPMDKSNFFDAVLEKKATYSEIDNFYSYRAVGGVYCLATTTNPSILKISDLKRVDIGDKDLHLLQEIANDRIKSLVGDRVSHWLPAGSVISSMYTKEWSGGILEIYGVERDKGFIIAYVSGK